MARYTNLSGLPIVEEINLAIYILKFFSAINNKNLRDEMGLPIKNGSITPFSLNDFSTYLKKKDDFDLYKERVGLFKIIRKMVEKGFLTLAGSNYDLMGFGQCYYSAYELSTKRRESDFWLTEVLGFNFLIERSKNIVVQIVGKTPNSTLR